MSGANHGPSLPPPGLVHLADFSVQVAPPRVDVDAAGGERRFVDILGGRVSGTGLNGRILPGGRDEQRVGAEGVIYIHARYLIETEDGTTLSVDSTGLRVTDPGATYFATTMAFETSAPGLLWMTRRLFVTNGERRDDRVLLSVYEVSTRV